MMATFSDKDSLDRWVETHEYNEKALVKAKNELSAAKDALEAAQKEYDETLTAWEQSASKLNKLRSGRSSEKSLMDMEAKMLGIPSIKGPSDPEDPKDKAKADALIEKMRKLEKEWENEVDKFQNEVNEKYDRLKEEAEASGDPKAVAKVKRDREDALEETWTGDPVMERLYSEMDETSLKLEDLGVDFETKYL